MIVKMIQAETAVKTEATPSLPDQTVELWGGMECTINRVGNDYFDQLHYNGHYDRKDDIALFAGLGLKKMRYPILWEHHQPDENQSINWQETDSKLQQLKNRHIGVIAGLVHHGSGPAFVDMMQDSFAVGLAQYASLVAERYPWIEYYTPVNEPLTTARFCGLYGIWYPHLKNDAAFCRILINECKATVMAMAAIRVFNPLAKLVQTDDLAKIHSTHSLKYQADFENERRWLSYDLLSGKVDRCHPLWGYLTENNIATHELDYFISNPCPPDILGVNYYLTSERYLDENTENYPTHTHGGNDRHNYADVEAVRVGGINPDGLQLLLKEAWQRYNMPIALTEVHLHCTREEQMRWLNDAWVTAKHLTKNGIPVIAITPWALLGSFGWDCLLTRRGGTYEAGVFDISGGEPRPTVLSQMITAYSRNVDFTHPVLNSPGWWQRTCRVTYGEAQLMPASLPMSQQLIISGIHAVKLDQICRRRCLDLAATIMVNEYMEISRTDCTELVIYLPHGDPDYCLQKGLDLLLDGESGYWEISPQGGLIKQDLELLSVQQLAV